ncbi:uncharacterized protein [Typha latifolia]
MADTCMDATCGDLFDHIDDLLDFSNEEDEALLEMAGSSAGNGHLIAPPPPDLDSLLPPPVEDDAFLAAAAGGGGGVETANVSVGDAVNRGKEDKFGACEDDIDMVQLEWLSNFFDDTTTDSFSTIFPNTTTNTDINISIPSAINKEEDHLLHFCTSSPVSVLESNTLRGGTGGGSDFGSGSGSASSSSSSSYSSSSYSFSGNSSSISSSSRSASPPEPILVVPARARSKRPRPTTFSPRPHVTVPFLPPSSDVQPLSNISSDPESIAESYPPPPPLTPAMKKKKKKKSKASFAASTSEAGDVDDDDLTVFQQAPAQAQAQAQAPPVRKCMHCEIQKTPQWRAGPMGPKTLCNACGVRYKSGRLFPEYRPAASPTFVPSIHSNSHKKVVEMRNKGTTQKPDCDLLGYIRRRE